MFFLEYLDGLLSATTRPFELIDVVHNATVSLWLLNIILNKHKIEPFLLTLQDEHWALVAPCSL